MLTVALVEDNDEDARALHDAISSYSNKNHVQFHIVRFREPTSFLEGYNPVWDIVFMDVEMPNMDGMEAAHKLREMDHQTVLIFVTNLAKLAAQGYEVEALDYIIKPFTYSDFERKIERAVAVARNAMESIVVSFRGGGRKILMREISYVEVRGHNVTYHTESGIITGTGSLQKVAESLSGAGFLRCSKPFLVNARHIDMIDGNSITLIGGEELPIGRAYRHDFMQQLAEVIGNDYIL
ncbi:response regulator transcription factor [Alloscardovia theropitheci]|uniref:Response regulator transcription factor n=1 Tax=Alloscardovia theropitheci TaxID=2496842 RepID=A0A4R0QST8_9BIFI|nr:LytTR family DNA-binding domain-containing protein [Alloscardovia theropitheci]TCD54235.1 response regulator transcription factor [Alloscardovia theropitheci]